MREVELEWFGLKVQGAVLTKRGSAFQDFFADIMEAAHPRDFERIRPYGNRGDLKCDGLLRSSGTVFQVYAPRQVKQALLLKKIRADFAGAKMHWKDVMRSWVFVHNDSDGLPGDVVLAMDALQKENDGLIVETWACDRLQSICLALPREKLILMFGRPPAVPSRALHGGSSRNVVVIFQRAA